ncbi:MAG: transcriptional regulator [Gemmataceae bacterium]|nr:transcriptional regulator [Gemmataceae bacterium]
MAETPGKAGRYAYGGLDRVLHEKARLGVLTALVARPGGVPFTELARLCSLTDGNLSRHLDVLAEAGLVEVRKGYDRRRPQTTCVLTGEGRKRFREYLGELEQVLRDAAAAEEAARDGQRRPGLAGA